MKLSQASATALCAASETGFIQPAQWIGWADAQILRHDRPEPWWIELSLATTPREVAAAMIPYWGWDGDAVLGFLVLMYREGRLSFGDFLIRAGLLADGNCSIECEYFYMHLNRLEASADPLAYEASAQVDLERELRSYEGLATSGREEIQEILEFSTP